MPDEMRSTGTPEIPAAVLDPGVLLIILLGLLVALPCLVYGFPFYSDDGISNAILNSEFARQFWSGELYPRWLQELNGGLGNPTAYYYPPLTFWFSSLLRPLFREDPHSWRLLGASAAIAVAASGLVVYYWLRRTVNSHAALIASLIYLILPYHVNIDLYKRGALAELWSFVWMPLVLWAVDRVIARGRFAPLGLACAYAALIMTHLPTTLIFSLIPLAYSLYVASAGERLRAFLLTTAGMSLGAGLSAIYLFPAMMMQNFVFHTTQGITGHYYFGNWFLFTSLKWSGSFSEFFVASVWAVFLAGFAFAIGRTDLALSLKKRTFFWFAVALGCFFMMTPLSKPIWLLLPTLQKVQFPWRFNTTLSLATAPLVAFASVKRTHKAQKIFMIVLVLLAISWIYPTSRRAYFSYPAHYFDQAVVDEWTKRLLLRRDTNEFRPRWAASIEERELDALLARIGQSQGELNRVRVVQGEATVTIEKWTPRTIELRVITPAGATLNVSRFYFPGWTLRHDDSQTAHAVEPSKPGGLISIAAPPGNHMLTLKLERRMPEVAGQVISGTSLVVLLSVAMIGLRRCAGPSEMA